jgi:hypothetical protein
MILLFNDVKNELSSYLLKLFDLFLLSLFFDVIKIELLLFVNFSTFSNNLSSNERIFGKRFFLRLFVSSIVLNFSLLKISVLFLLFV